MKKILVLESDGAVVDALASEFAVYGCMVDAVDDAEMARQKAGSDRFELVIISTALAKSHGFLAFTFLKRLPELESTPFVIMYSPNEVDQIISHQNRPTHADVYIQKPFDFAELLGHITGYLDIEADAGATGRESTEELVLDDAVVVDDTDDVDVESGAEAVSAISDDELAALETPTDDAAFAESPVPFDAHPEPEPEPEPKPKGKGKHKSKAEPEPVAVAATANRAEPPAEILAELEQARERVRNLDADLKDSRKKAEEAAVKATAADEQRSKFEQELDLLRAKADDLGKALSEKGSSSVSTRELLDLRELINRKDKESLKLKDELNSREKLMLEGQDKLLEQQRAAADLEDKLHATEAQVRTLERSLEASTKDKETASKRAEDFKSHWETSKQEVASLKDEIETQRKSHAEEMTSSQATLRKEAEESRQAALVEQETNLGEEKASEIGALKASHEKALQELKDQYEAEIADIREKFDGDLRNLERKAEEERGAALASMRVEHEKKTSDLELALREKEQINKALMKESSSQETQIEKLQAEVKGLQERGEQLKNEVADLTALKEKLSADVSSLRSHSEGLAKDLEEEKTKLGGVQSHLSGTEDLLGDVRDSLKSVVGILESYTRYSR